MIVLHNATIVNEGTRFTGYVAVEGTLIADVGSGEIPQRYATAELIDCRGAIVMPGAIDTHVHFREPGMTAKGTIASESRAARAGGITSYIEMPNTKPATTDMEQWQWKMNRARECSAVNYAFFLGATADNLPELLSADYTRVAGVKVFMGSSTGGMLLDGDGALREVFRQVPALICVHAEDEQLIAQGRREAQQRHPDGAIPVSEHSCIRSAESCLHATERALALAREYGTRLHVAHVSTLAEAMLFTQGEVECKRITAETCPQYLLFTTADYQSKGSRIKCNPAIKDDAEGLRQQLLTGRIDTIATDHAPHLPADKKGDALTAASGMPGVQFALPLMLGLLGPELAVEKMCHNPARIFGIEGRGFLRKGYAADIVIAEKLDEPHTIVDDDVVSPCGWTPYEGLPISYRIAATMVNGSLTDGAEPLQFKPQGDKKNIETTNQ